MILLLEMLARRVMLRERIVICIYTNGNLETNWEIIVVNPASVLNIPTFENLTKDIKDEKILKISLNKIKTEKDFKVENYWRV